jgi:hypothetical protein
MRPTHINLKTDIYIYKKYRDMMYIFVHVRQKKIFDLDLLGEGGARNLNVLSTSLP